MNVASSLAPYFLLPSQATSHWGRTTMERQTRRDAWELRRKGLNAKLLIKTLQSK